MSGSSIKFTQGITTPGAGIAMLGSTGTPVVVSNGNDASISNWKFTIVDVPPGSAVPTGVVQNGATPTYSFTPDLSGCYLFQLDTTNTSGQVATDQRAFGVVNALGRLVPPFTGVASALNFGGRSRGWAPDMEKWLAYVTYVGGRVADVRDYGALGNGVADDSAAITAATAAVSGAGGRVYFPPGTYRTTVTHTFPSNVAVEFQRAAVLSPTTNAVNIYGPVHAATTQQIFSPTTIVAFFNGAVAGSLYTTEIYAAWWGAIGDYAGGTSSGTDNTTALRSALASVSPKSFDAFGGGLRLGRGLYRITDSLTVYGATTASYPAWAAGHVYSAGDIIQVGSFLHLVAVAGTSGGSQPAFVGQVDSKVNDNGVIWRCLTTATRSQLGVRIRGPGTGLSGDTVDCAIVCDFAEPSGIGAALSNTGHLTGVSGFDASDVGTWVHLTNVATASNFGPFQISVVTSPSDITLSDFVGEWTPVADVGLAGGIHWVHPTRSAIRFWSADCVLEEVAIISSDGRVIYGAVEDNHVKEGGVDAIVLSANTVRNVVIAPHDGVTGFVHAIVHADQATTPGRNLLVGGDGENNRYDRVEVFNFLGSGFYCPDQTGQSKDTVFNHCQFGGHLGQRTIAGVLGVGDIATFFNCAVGHTPILFFPQGCTRLSVYELENEGAGRLVKQPNSSGSTSTVAFIGGRIAMSSEFAADGLACIFRGAGSLMLQGLAFDGPLPTFSLDVRNATASGPTNLTCLDCSFPSASPIPNSTGTSSRVTVIGCTGNSVALPDIYGAWVPVPPGTLVNGNNNDVSFTVNGGTANPYDRVSFTGPTAACVLTGLLAGIDGQHIRLFFDFNQQVTIAHLSASSASKNRFITPSGADLVLAPPGAGGYIAVHAVYAQEQNGGTGAWRVVSST